METAVMDKLELRPVDITHQDVPCYNGPKIQAKAAKIGKRLAKIGAPVPEVTFGPVKKVTEKDEFGREYSYNVYETVTVTGVEAGFAGWTPVAVLDHRLSPTEALISLFPTAIEAGTGCPEKFRHRGSVCDHCGIKIRRNTTVVFHHEDGRWTQVGSTCILEFIGVDPATILWLVESPMTIDDDEEAGGSGGGHRYADPFYFLAIAAEFTARYGFVPTRTDDYRATPTRIDVEGWMYAKDPHEQYGFTDISAGEATAKAIVEWLPTAGQSEFFQSARLAVAADKVIPRTAGLLAALPHVYSKAMADKIEAEIAPVIPDSEFIGKVGEKLSFAGVCIKAMTFDGDYGARRLISVRNADGVIVSTFGSGQSLFNTEQGETVTITGTIKAHEDRGYGRQTMLIRAKVA